MIHRRVVTPGPTDRELPAEIVLLQATQRMAPLIMVEGQRPLATVTVLARMTSPRAIHPPTVMLLHPRCMTEPLNPRIIIRFPSPLVAMLATETTLTAVANHLPGATLPLLDRAVSKITAVSHRGPKAVATVMRTEQTTATVAVHLPCTTLSLLGRMVSKVVAMPHRGFLGTMMWHTITQPSHPRFLQAPHILGNGSLVHIYPAGAGECTAQALYRLTTTPLKS